MSTEEKHSIPALNPDEIPSEVAVEALASNIAEANPEERLEILGDLQEKLNDQGVVLHDTGLPQKGERQGVRTGRTRDQVLNEVEFRQQRMRRLGRRAI